MDTLLLTATATIGKKALETIWDDIYKCSKDVIKRQIEILKAKNSIDKLFKKISNIRKVKTIYQLEKEIDLTKFYSPSRISINNVRKMIQSIDDFSYDGNIVVRGIIGQGKSIFLRYLASTELYRGKVIPILIELRKVSSKKPLMEYIIDECHLFDLNINKEIFVHMADLGKLILFLDGFDEVPENTRTQLITQIENLTKKHEKLRIFVTTRPDSGICCSPFFRVFELSDLRGNEYKDVISKMADNQDAANEIIKVVERSQIRSLLTTPLMVALLMLRYKIDQSVPENTISFYDNLFDLLLQRHDKSKAGYSRPRKSSLGDYAIEEVFDTLCFLTRRNNVSSFTLNELSSTVDEALHVTNHSVDPKNYLEDIVKITCLILEDSGNYKFIHKSVQEYHAAMYVKAQPDAFAIKFYEAMSSRFQNWGQVLRFLAEIDKYRFLKYFWNIETQKLFSKYPDHEKPSKETCQSLISNISVCFEQCPPTKISSIVTRITPKLNYYYYNEIFRPKIINIIFESDFSELFKDISQSEFNILNGRYETELLKFYKKGKIGAAIDNAIEQSLAKIYEEFKKNVNYIKQKEATSDILKF